MCAALAGSAKLAAKSEASEAHTARSRIFLNIRKPQSGEGALDAPPSRYGRKIKLRLNRDGIRADPPLGDIPFTLAAIFLDGRFVVTSSHGLQRITKRMSEKDIRAKPGTVPKLALFFED